MKSLKTKTEKNDEKEFYTKYRWFYTSSGKLVIGGKSADQNEELVKNHIKPNPKYVVMHTKSPGSPFSVILADNYTKLDLEETAIFTGAFSRAWREGKKNIIVDIFLSEQIIKNKGMKTGTFGVVGTIDRKKVELKLYLTKQKNKSRFVPQKIPKTIIITPGKTSKDQIAEEIAIKREIPKDEILNSLPTGGSRIVK